VTFREEVLGIFSQATMNTAKRTGISHLRHARVDEATEFENIREPLQAHSTAHARAIVKF